LPALWSKKFLAEDTFLDDGFLRQLMSVGEVDLLVGIPSYNNADTMAQTLHTIEESLQQNFVRERVAILNVDGGSTDDTCKVLLQSNHRRNPGSRGLTSLRTVHRISSQYANSPAPGIAIRTVAAAADLLRAKSCAIVSPGTTNLTPSWIANLLRPIYRERCDYVAPLYVRGKYQGLLARELLYPMSRGVFGQRMRELYSDEWGFSARLASYCLDQNVWQEEAVRTRPEAWMGITAICSGLKSCQSFLGPKVPAAGASAPDIVEAVRQTVGNLFWCMEQNEEHWLDRRASEMAPTFGPDHELIDEEAPGRPEKMLELFRGGVSELEPILLSILSPGTHARIKEIAARDDWTFCLANDLWVKALYEFAAAYHHAVLNRNHLVQALVPLYRGRLYSFLREYVNCSSEEMEAATEALCLEFENQKPYLIERWKVKN
jgi:glucosylglycerate synthase